MTLYRLHVPTRVQSTREIDRDEAETRLQALELVNSWNRLGNGVWVYWL